MDGTVIAIIIILAVAVLSVSLWLFRTRLRYRATVAQPQLVKKCPNCGTMMAPEAAFCPNCGTPVPRVTTVV
jgi:rRNA maturation endonuclease Nob1